MCGKFHPTCAPSLVAEARFKVAREDPRVIAAGLVTSAAWDAYQAARHGPFEAWDLAEKAWRKAIDGERAISSAVYAETAVPS